MTLKTEQEGREKILQVNDAAHLHDSLKTKHAPTGIQEEGTTHFLIQHTHKYGNI